jgi:hypothetical protein
VSQVRVLRHHQLSPGKHKKTYEKVLDALRRDDMRTADVKKLGGGPYYRAKLDYEARLLLRFGKKDDVIACFALEIIEGHAFERSRFLRGARFDEAQLVALDEDQPVEAPPLRYLHPQRDKIHFLDRPISFDDVQDAALRTRTPLLILGSAGSGKTAVTLERLRATPGNVAYVTQSPYLAETARELYFSHGYEEEEREVDFFSFAELLASHRVPEGRAVSFADFRVFFERHRSKAKFADAHQCFEELRGVLGAQPEGPLSREAYLALGVRQSIFLGDQRSAIWDLFQSYLEWLRSASLWDSNVVAHAYARELTPRWDFVMVDEVQDLTNAELTLILRGLRVPGAFALCGDANQIVHPNFFSWANLRSLFFRDAALEDVDRVHVLSSNYRNATRVTNVANRLLRVKHARFGSVDRESDTLAQATSDEEGIVVGVRASDKVTTMIDAATRKSTSACVIVLRDEHKAEARRRFGTPLLFSVHEVKGLEYDTVILYGLVTSERSSYRELCAGVTAASLDTDDLAFRRAKDKGDKSLEVYKFFANALYVSLTRAVRRVYVVDDDVDHPLWGLLDVPMLDTLPTFDVKQASLEEWQREARKLELQGKTEQADAIRTRVLRLEPVPWKVLDRAKNTELHERAFEKGNVFQKAKQQLWDYALFYDDPVLARRLTDEGGFQPPRGFGAEAHLNARERNQPAMYASTALGDTLRQTERHGLELRTPMNLTPLMHAVIAGNVGLIEALVHRGADLGSRDGYGRTALSWCILRAFPPNGASNELDLAWMRGAFGRVFDLVAAPRIDVEVAGRLVKVGREHGEYLVFELLCALFRRQAYRTRFGRDRGFKAEHVASFLAECPDVVTRESRRKRTYLNAVLARSEDTSSYATSRRLWVRERQGHYVPNPAVKLRVAEQGGGFAPVLAVLGLDVVENDMHPRATSLLTRTAALS